MLIRCPRMEFIVCFFFIFLGYWCIIFVLRMHLRFGVEYNMILRDGMIVMVDKWQLENLRV